MTAKERMIWLAGNALLGALLALLLVRVLIADREDWPGFVGDESTYLMAAESLAWDLDLYYERADFDRFVRHWDGKQDELLLFLQSKDQGRTIAYAKPFYYPLFAAPLTRVAPVKGALIANVLILALATACAVRALRRQLGAGAPLWVACFLFASVAFAYCFWAHSDLFLMSLVTIGLSLAFEGYGRGDSEPDGNVGRRLFWLRWAAVGATLGIVGYSRPFYLPLLLPAALAAPRQLRFKAGAALGAGAALMIVPAVAVHLTVADAWTGYTGERSGFYGRNGLPAVDFPAEEWDEAVARTGRFAWHEAKHPLDQPSRASLWTWNGLYLLAGRHIGLVPYFLPFLVGFLGRPRGWARWALLAAVLISTAGFFLYRPFNFYGGGAAIGNRYFLPLYPAAWFLLSRRRSLLWPAGVTLAAAVFLWPIWTEAGRYPLEPDQTYRFVSPAAERMLPFETTQSHVKPGGQEDVRHRGLWVKMLVPEVRSKTGDGFALAAGDRAELLVATRRPLQALELELEPGPAATLVADGLDAEPSKRFTDRAAWRLALESPRARHPMWWTWEPWNLYLVSFRLDGASTSRYRFYLNPVWQPRAESHSRG